jgi:putative phage-type endonuclease
MPRLTPEQIAGRRSGLGSSDIAEVVGLAPWEGASPIRLYAEKRGLLPVDDAEPSEQQELGHLLEPLLVQLYERKSKYETLPGGTVQHRAHPWAFASLDAKILGKSAALEIKLVGVGMMRHWDFGSDDGIPHYVRAQCAWAMACAELDEVHVSVLLCGTQHRVFYVRRDRELEAELLAAGETFWGLVQAGTPPPLDGTDGTRTYLEARFPSPPAELEVEADASIRGVGVARAGYAVAQSRAESNKREADAAIMSWMGERNATVAWCPEWRATWRAGKAGGRRAFRFTPRQAVAAAEASGVDDGAPF